MHQTALLLVDLQNDFCANGSLAVPGGDNVINVANQAMCLFRQYQAPILASLDWHPKEHGSFAINAGKKVGEIGELDGLPQVWWPLHCVQGSAGAQLHQKLNREYITHKIYKGQQTNVDSYSAFFDNGKRHSTGLDEWLTAHQIRKLWVMGLATDYCVKFTVLDALELGYEVNVLIDGCRGVNLSCDDSYQALREMRLNGASLSTLAELQQSLKFRELESA